MAENNDILNDLLKDFIASIPEVKGIMLFDLNGTIIAQEICENDKNSDLGIMSALSVLSMKNFLKMIRVTEFNRFYLRKEQGYIFIVQIDAFRYLSIFTNKDIKLGLIFLDSKRLQEKLIPLIGDRQINSDIQTQLGNFEESVLQSYRLFFSYAIKDSNIFQIRQIAEYWESHNTNVQVRFFERDKRVGRDILDYMETGISWCNRFIWFHSENSMESGAVNQEYKMAQFEGKKIFTISKNPKILPLSAKSNKSIEWTGYNNINLENILQQIIQL